MSDCEAGFSGRNLMLAVLVGAIAGAGAVMLLAPRVRRRAAERIRGLTHDLPSQVSAAVGPTEDEASLTVS